MKIAVVYRYFAPDTPPYAIMLEKMTAWLAAEGHDVEVLTAQPAYKPEAAIPQQPWRDMRNGVHIRRFWLLPERARGMVRAFNSLCFVLRAAANILFGPRRDLVWTATMPPVIQAFLLCAVAKLRGARFLYHMQDIYPEVAEATGTRFSPPLAWCLRRLDNWTLRHADACVVLSTDMADTIRSRVGENARLAIINNFALATSEEAAKIRDGKPVRFLFAGNIGRYQSLPELVKAFAGVPADDAELVLLGEGALKAELIKLAEGMGHVRFLDHVPAAEAFRQMQSAHYGIVSLVPGLYRYAFPSKLLTYLAASLPVVAIIEPESRLAAMIRDNHLGHVLPSSNSPADWGKALARIAETQDASAPLKAPREIFHPDEIRGQWLSLMRKLEAGRT